MTDRPCFKGGTCANPRHTVADPRNMAFGPDLGPVPQDDPCEVVEREEYPRVSQRLEIGDLDAALARTSVETGLTSAISLWCVCGENLTPGPDGMGLYGDVTMLDLVNRVAEHVAECREVKR